MGSKKGRKSSGDSPPSSSKRKADSPGDEASKKLRNQNGGASRVPSKATRVPSGDTRVPSGDTRLPSGDTRVPSGDTSSIFARANPRGEQYNTENNGGFDRASGRAIPNGEQYNTPRNGTQQYGEVEERPGDQYPSIGHHRGGESHDPRGQQAEILYDQREESIAEEQQPRRRTSTRTFRTSNAFAEDGDDNDEEEEDFMYGPGDNQSVEDSGSEDRSTGKKKNRYAVTTKSHPNGRKQGRNLVNWKQPRDLQVLLIMVHEMHAAGLDAENLWAKVVRRLHNDPHKTGPTVSQHLDKLRQRLFDAGALVPPWNGRDNCPAVSQRIRGIVKDPRKTCGWREVSWDEDFEEHLNPNAPLDTTTSTNQKHRKITNPGKREKGPYQFRDPMDKGYDMDPPLLMRKKTSSTNVVLDRHGNPMPRLPEGYSARKVKTEQQDDNFGTPEVRPRRRSSGRSSRPKKQEDEAKKFRHNTFRKDVEVKPQHDDDDDQDDEEYSDGGEDEVPQHGVQTHPVAPMNGPGFHGNYANYRPHGGRGAPGGSSQPLAAPLGFANTMRMGHPSPGPLSPFEHTMHVGAQNTESRHHGPRGESQNTSMRNQSHPNMTRPGGILPQSSWIAYNGRVPLPHQFDTDARGRQPIPRQFDTDARGREPLPRQFDTDARGREPQWQQHPPPGYTSGNQFQYASMMSQFGPVGIPAPTFAAPNQSRGFGNNIGNSASSHQEMAGTNNARPDHNLDRAEQVYNPNMLDNGQGYSAGMLNGNVEQPAEGGGMTGPQVEQDYNAMDGEYEPAPATVTNYDNIHAEAGQAAQENNNGYVAHSAEPTVQEN